MFSPSFTLPYPPSISTPHPQSPLPKLTTYHLPPARPPIPKPRPLPKPPPSPLALVSSSHPPRPRGRRFPQLPPPGGPHYPDKRAHADGTFTSDLFHSRYQCWRQYPQGMADMVGYWAEAQILSGVVVFEHHGEEEGVLRYAINTALEVLDCFVGNSLSVSSFSYLFSYSAPYQY